METFAYIGNGINEEDLNRIISIYKDYNVMYYGVSYLKNNQIETKKSNLYEFDSLKDVIGSNIVIGVLYKYLKDGLNNKNFQPINDLNLSIVYKSIDKFYSELYSNFNPNVFVESESEALFRYIKESKVHLSEIPTSFNHFTSFVIQDEYLIIKIKGCDMFENNIGTGRLYCNKKLNNNYMKLIRFHDKTTYNEVISKLFKID